MSQLLLRITRVAQTDPDRTAVISRDRRGEEAGRLSYGALLRASRQMAGELAKGGRGPVVLAIEDACEFAVAFIAALWAGRPAVPVPAPETHGARQRCSAILQALGPSEVLCRPQDSQIWDDLGAACRVQVAALPVPAEAAMEQALDAALAMPAEAIAFIQFSSGTTSTPKGLCISHAALDTNLRMIEGAFEIGPADIGIGWLPLHHDMGLVGFLLEPLWAGIPTVIMPPAAFLMQPLRWLEAISKYRGTICGAPSFGFDVCTRRIAVPPAGLDLSSLRVAFCGAEAINPRALSDFAERFAPVGFRDTCYLPCYGLAEAVLMVTCARPGDGVRTQVTDAGIAQVSCGPPVAPRRLRIVDAAAKPVGDGVVGEICIGGPGLASGVWSADGPEPFAPQTTLFDGEEAYFRTGDLGFLRDGELVVVGRVDAAFNLNGRKFQAEELERVALEAGDPAAVGQVAIHHLASEAREVWLLVEIHPRAKREGDRIALEMAACLTKAFGISVRAQPLRRGSLPLTTSGKIARHRLGEVLESPGLTLDLEKD